MNNQKINRTLAAFCALAISISAGQLLLTQRATKQDQKILFNDNKNEEVNMQFEDWRVIANGTAASCYIMTKEKYRLNNENSSMIDYERTGAFGGGITKKYKWQWRFMYNSDQPIPKGSKVIVQLNYDDYQGKQFELDGYGGTAAVTPTEKMGFEIFRGIRRDGWINVAVVNSHGATDVLYVSTDGFWEATEYCYDELGAVIYNE